MKLRVSDEVREALAGGGAVVALESSLIAHGLPSPHNVETALAAEPPTPGGGGASNDRPGRRRAGGRGGRSTDRAPGRPGAADAKAGARDLGPLLATRRLAATTVSATMRLAALAGIRVMATGGIGGVHLAGRAPPSTFPPTSTSWRPPRWRWCAAGRRRCSTWQPRSNWPETRRVPVIGMGTDHVPVFYAAASSLPVAFRVDSAAEAAAIIDAHFGLSGSGGLLLVQPPPADLALMPRRWRPGPARRSKRRMFPA